jgi:hypothetical protein
VTPAAPQTRWYGVRVPRLTLRTTFVAAACIVASIQLVSVTLAALPPNRYSDAARPHITYLDPFFTQNWRLFAPNPVSQDRNVLFQGAYKGPGGKILLTPWLDWTAVELDIVHHRLVGGRAGYITNKMFSPLSTRTARLSSEQSKASLGTSEETPPTWAAFRDQLLTVADTPITVNGYLRYERAAAQLATDVLMSRWPKRDFTAVRYSLQRQDVVPYTQRHGSDEQREAARPAADNQPSGWRQPTPGGAAERRSVGDFYRRHR